MKSTPLNSVSEMTPETSRSTIDVKIKKVSGHSSRHIQDTLAVEEPLEIQWLTVPLEPDLSSPSP